MCLLALFYRVVKDAAVVVGANREEAYRRGGSPPQLHAASVRWVGGVDPTAGGTWLGVNEHSMLAAVTNRRKDVKPARPRSRGLLVRDLLGCPSASAAVDVAVRELAANRYDGCNIVCADARDAVVVHGSDWLRVRPLPPGLHVLTNGDVNDERDARRTFAAHLLGQEGYRYRSSADCMAVLKELCSRHEPGEPPICLHGDDRGTTSSTIVALRSSLDDSVYLHAQGPPDATPYEDYSELLREMNGDGP
ncbi:MAG TPA: NRDE family protein [Gemmataceae bacterium]|nr:NRDE family protein [Gemmataceae bacterium]